MLLTAIVITRLHKNTSEANLLSTVTNFSSDYSFIINHADFIVV